MSRAATPSRPGRAAGDGELGAGQPGEPWLDAEGGLPSE